MTASAWLIRSLNPLAGVDPVKPSSPRRPLACLCQLVESSGAVEHLGGKALERVEGRPSCDHERNPFAPSADDTELTFGGTGAAPSPHGHHDIDAFVHRTVRRRTQSLARKLWLVGLRAT
jgi:hypothetical protein